MSSGNWISTFPAGAEFLTHHDWSLWSTHAREPQIPPRGPHLTPLALHIARDRVRLYHGNKIFTNTRGHSLHLTMVHRMVRGANGKPLDPPVALNYTPHRLKSIPQTGPCETNMNGRRIGNLYRREGGSGPSLSRFPTNGTTDETPPRPSVNSSETWRSSIEQTSGTERSSVLTKSSSITDLSPDTPDTPFGMDRGMSVEDAISMYLDGFSDATEEPSSPKSHTGSKAPSITPPPSRDSHLGEAYPLEFPSLGDIPPIPPMPKFATSRDTRPDSLFLPNSTFSEHSPIPPILPESAPELTALEPTLLEYPEPDPSDPVVPDSPYKVTPSASPVAEAPEVHHAHQRQASKKVFIPGLVPPLLRSGNGPRDDYGFRKATQHVSLDEYETWKGSYSHHVIQRRSKWCELLREHGLPTSEPTIFPPQSSKVKRFVRKGIPPEFRGAAWFYYAGGYELLNQNPGQYDELVAKAMSSPSNDDKEHIERDLHRTFPDNLHFKPDATELAQDPGGGSLNYSNVTTETQMIQSLRRVLYAYALHNPKIGYTQSLNFITGMLLLFLPEEKAFWMLHIIAADYLPGTHEISLEGANIDLWILMVLLRDSMPGTYSKIAVMGGTPSGRGKMPPLTVNSRLPDITLGLTNWLMSLFIGSLPVETTLRVWDVFFYEGSKTFFRVSLAIFKSCEKDILAVTDPMEAFQIVQSVPKKLLDANTLLDECFVRRHRVGQGRIEELRAQRRAAIREEKLRRSVAFGKGQLHSKTDDFTDRSPTAIPGVEHRVVGSWRHLKQHAFR
ncbi:GTPase activating protein (Gyp3), putative [Penicillium digitatum]|uniref:GTPase activating protein (Gyp3), putative n=1 Tax=Penicillium digitatum TaxID=36651 RepID=A0A7T6XU22_PENDI|nr:GTPase activating protein (Gyp3), putative [Penicillium digitatum]